MIIGGTHWLLALGIALSIHLAGMLWLSFPSPTRQPLADRTSESVVVTLGPDARRAATDARAPAPQDSPAIEALAAAAARQPEAADPASSPEVAEAEPVRTAMDQAAVEAAGPVEPDAAGETATPESEPAAEPEAVIEEQATETPAAPAAVTPEQAAEDAAELESPPSEPVAAREASEPSVRAIDVQSDIREAPQQTAGQPDIVATIVQPRAPADTGPAVEAEGVAAPTAFAAEAPVPEPAAPSAPSASAEPSPANPGDVPDVEATSVEPASNAAASVEAARTVQAEETGPARQVESVEVGAAEQPDVEVTGARQPSPDVAPTSDPDVREAEEPEVIDLRELQESGDGSGVAARYAGVLKGWLQENMHYPRAARLAGQEGEVVVRFVIDRDGNVQSIELESKSGFPLLDREAREMIERGDPFPHMPEDMPGGRLEVRVPVNFHVHDETMTKEIPPIYLE